MKLSHLYFINHNSGLGILIVDIGTLDCCHTSWPFVSNKQLNVPEKPKLKCLGFTYNGGFSGAGTFLNV